MSEEGEITSATEYGYAPQLSKSQQLAQMYYHSCEDNARLLRVLEEESLALRESEASCHHLQQEITRLEDMRADLKHEIHDLHTRIMDIRARNELLERRMKKDKKEETQVEGLREEITRLNKSREKLHDSGQAIIDEKNRRILQLKGDLDGERKQVKSLASKLESSTPTATAKSLEYLKLVLVGKNEEIAALRTSVKGVSTTHG